MHRFTFEQPTALRLKRLLRMEYTLRELATEIRCSRRKVRTAVEAGAPHRRTPSGRIWIRGDAFRDWYRHLVEERKHPLGPNEAYCLACKRAVPLGNNVEITPQAHGVERLTATCPRCGNEINRFRRGA